MANRSKLLGGEGCPVAPITKPAENRNIFDEMQGYAMQDRAGSWRTGKEQTGAADTPLTQQTEFRIALCSEFEDWIDRQTFTPEDAAAAEQALLFLRLPYIPQPLMAKFAEAVRTLANMQEAGR